VKKLFLLLSCFIISNSGNAQNEPNLKGLEKLARQGELTAQVELANAYRKGIGVTQD
jgi:TPR repeat protein